MKLREKSLSTDDFIRQYPVLPSDICSKLISKYENSKQKQFVDNNGYPTFTQVNLNKEDMSSIKDLIPYVSSVVTTYKSDLEPFTNFWPNRLKFEEFRIKKYIPDGNQRFDLHVDVADHASAKRFLAMLFYLNDDFEGGKTIFPSLENLTVVPKTGNVLVFPPTWQYPHLGEVVGGSNKYIMSTYLHYG